ncbi:PLD nuclease N-terminal domain-containing protein [Glutamicibacter sp. NPDC087344]|uniref:PLD nuclease N-terminal domain-containing protein n=1 Tax=Glutamicibacter sp. NPDC087344 TaxID=3363994 RepID=UPI0037F68DDE
MVRIIIFAALISVALMIYTLIECARSEAHQVRSLPKPAWFAVIFFLPLIGAALWFTLGRPLSAEASAAQTSKAPDDDEDFLRQLEVWRRQQQRDAELTKREEELKRREAEKSKDQSADKPAKENKDHKNKSDGNGTATPDS